jgi:RNA polymerase sigma-70 factor (ECF subfamily)
MKTGRFGEREWRAHLAAWVATEIIPHEAAVRAWCRRFRLSSEDVDELIQDAYCRIAMLNAIDHIVRPDAYYFSIVRNLLVRRLKRARVVQIDAIAEIEAFSIDDTPSPERQAGARLDYLRMLALIADLPERCRQIVYMRRVDGLSQREIALRLGVTEKVVEKQVWQGVRALKDAWAEGDAAADARMDARETEARQ